MLCVPAERAADPYGAGEVPGAKADVDVSDRPRGHVVVQQVSVTSPLTGRTGMECSVNSEITVRRTLRARVRWRTSLPGVASRGHVPTHAFPFRTQSTCTASSLTAQSLLPRTFRELPRAKSRAPEAPRTKSPAPVATTYVFPSGDRGAPRVDG